MGYDRHDIENEDVLSRTFIGQIVTVNTKTGIMQVVVPKLNHIFDVEVPVAMMRYRGRESSWDRSMPGRGDFVRIQFETDNTPHATGFALWDNDPATALALGSTFVDRHMGYARLADLQAKSIAGQTETVQNTDGTTTEVEPGLDEFIPLESGEYDRRSSGGAYIHGSRGGVLTLAGGAASWKLDKERYEARGDAGLHKLTSGMSFFSFGNVKRRLLPTDFSDKIPPADLLPVEAPGQPRQEWRIHIAGAQGVVPVLTPVGPIVSIIGVPLLEKPVYDLFAGDVRDPLTAYSTFKPGVVPAIPTRVYELVYDESGFIPTYTRQVDQGGNLSLIMPVATLGNVAMPLATVSALFANLLVTTSNAMTQTAGGAMTMTAGGVLTALATALMTLKGASVNVDGLSVDLGTIGLTQPAVHGPVLVTVLTELLTTAIAFATSMAALEGGPLTPKGAAWMALVTALGVIQVQVAQPPGPTSLLALKAKVE